jgi:hypothetical protein
MRALVILALAVCSSGGLHDQDEPESFQEMVQRIVRSSRENMRPLKTSRIEMRPSMDYWYEVTHVLPGARTCRVYEHPEMVYKCEWKHGKDISAAYERVANDLAGALGGVDWKTVSSRRVTRFEPFNPKRNGIVEVRVAGPTRDPVLEVMFFAVVRE